MPTVRELANLVMDRAATDSTILTYRAGQVPTRPAKGYASFYFGGGTPSADRLYNATVNLGWGFRVICVGYDDDEALRVVGRIRALYTNWRPYPDDRSVGWFTEAPDDPPLIRDDSVPNDIRYSLTPRFTITTRST